MAPTVYSKEEIARINKDHSKTIKGLMKDFLMKNHDPAPLRKPEPGEESEDEEQQVRHADERE